MNSVHCFQKLAQINQLVAQESTGTPNELAQKLSVSKRTVHNYINVMRDLNAPIVYNRKIKSYCYEQKWEFNLLDLITKP